MSLLSLLVMLHVSIWLTRCVPVLPVVKVSFLFLVHRSGGPAASPSMTWARFCHFSLLCHEACCVPSARAAVSRHIWSLVFSFRGSWSFIYLVPY